MKLGIYGAERLTNADYLAVLAKALDVAARWDGCNAELYLAARQGTDWVQCTLRIDRGGDRDPFIVGLIQRKPGDEIEAHS